MQIFVVPIDQRLRPLGQLTLLDNTNENSIIQLHRLRGIEIRNMKTTLGT